MAKGKSNKTNGPVVTEGTNQIENLEAKEARLLAQKQINRKNLALEYKKEDEVPVNISPFYRPYLGNAPRIQVNGIGVYVPCDGKTYKIPTTLAAELKRKVASIDKTIARQARQSDVGNNFEKSIGELKL